MARSVDRPQAGALALPWRERVRLTRLLLKSLNEESKRGPAPLGRSWGEEIERRLVQWRAMMTDATAESENAEAHAACSDVTPRS